MPQARFRFVARATVVGDVFGLAFFHGREFCAARPRIDPSRAGEPLPSSVARSGGGSAPTARDSSGYSASTDSCGSTAASSAPVAYAASCACAGAAGAAARGTCSPRSSPCSLRRQRRLLLAQAKTPASSYGRPSGGIGSSLAQAGCQVCSSVRNGRRRAQPGARSLDKGEGQSLTACAARPRRDAD